MANRKKLRSRRSNESKITDKIAESKVSAEMKKAGFVIEDQKNLKDLKKGNFVKDTGRPSQ